MKLNFERKEVKQWIKKLDNGGSSAVISAFKDWLILADEVERQAKLIERLVEDAERLAEEVKSWCYELGSTDTDSDIIHQHNTLMQEVE